MATEKLYYQDAHQAAFEARVVSCQPGKHGYDVVLDRTCFYPEGGGQPVIIVSYATLYIFCVYIQ